MLGGLLEGGDGAFLVAGIGESHGETQCGCTVLRVGCYDLLEGLGGSGVVLVVEQGGSLLLLHLGDKRGGLADDIVVLKLLGGLDGLLELGDALVVFGFLDFVLGNRQYDGRDHGLAGTYKLFSFFTASLGQGKGFLESFQSLGIIFGYESLVGVLRSLSSLGHVLSGHQTSGKNDGCQSENNFFHNAKGFKLIQV